MNVTELQANVLHLRAFDSEQLLEAVQGARFEHFVLKKSDCEARLDRWSCGDFVVDRGRYNFPVRARGPFPAKKICLGYMRGSRDATWVNGFHVTPRTLEIYPEGTELDYRTGSAAEWLAIEFSRETLQRAAIARLGRELDLPWKHVVSFEIPPPARAALDALVQRLWSPSRPGLPKIDPILGIIAETLDFLERGSPLPAAPNWKKREELLRRVDRFLDTRPSAPFDLSTLASAVGATPRTLQREFLHAYGITPREWARCFALHRVRSDLVLEGF